MYDESQLPQMRRCYFIDESGDGTLFDAQGCVIIGQPGCSRLFVLGLLAVADPDDLTEQMNALRTELLADPYFRSVPSFDPMSHKTSIAFHAKDDLPEVRREVFSLLRRRQDLEFFAVIRDKLEVLRYVQSRNTRDSAYRYHPNELYDYMVRRLTKGLLHKCDEYQLCFARRGKKDRTQALLDALLVAQQRSVQQTGLHLHSRISVLSCAPEQSAGLQAVDYFLWALQRLLVRQEERYWSYIWPACKLVIDIDDKRDASYGRYYSQKRPLSLAALDQRYFST